MSPPLQKHYFLHFPHVNMCWFSAGHTGRFWSQNGEEFHETNGLITLSKLGSPKKDSCALQSLTVPLPRVLEGYRWNQGEGRERAVYMMAQEDSGFRMWHVQAAPQYWRKV